MLTESDLRRLALNEKQSFECVGLDKSDTVLVAVAIDRCFIAGLAYWLGLREIGCAVARVGPASPLLVMEMIERLQPTAIVAVPSAKSVEYGIVFVGSGLAYSQQCTGSEFQVLTVSPSNFNIGLNDVSFEFIIP